MCNTCNEERPCLMTWFCPSIMSPDPGPGAGTMAPSLRTIPHHLQTGEWNKVFQLHQLGTFCHFIFDSCNAGPIYGHLSPNKWNETLFISILEF